MGGGGGEGAPIFGGPFELKGIWGVEKGNPLFGEMPV